MITEHNINNCLILAGGKREEFSGIAGNRCMLLIKGKSILEHVIERLVSFNIKNILVYSDNSNDEIRRHLTGTNITHT